MNAGCGDRNGYRFSVLTRTIFENTKVPSRAGSGSATSCRLLFIRARVSSELLGPRLNHHRQIVKRGLLVSHHFDTPTAKEDPRINVCDFYLFRGRPGTTVMALTVNPNAGVRTRADTFRDDGPLRLSLRAPHRDSSAKTSPSRRPPSRLRPPTPMAMRTGTFRPSTVSARLRGGRAERRRGRTVISGYSPRTRGGIAATQAAWPYAAASRPTNSPCTHAATATKVLSACDEQGAAALSGRPAVDAT